MQYDLFGHEDPFSLPHTQPGNLDALLALVANGQRYACILADPPWPYTNRVTRGAAAKHYDTLSITAMQQMPVAQLALPKAHLHLWVTNAFLEEGLSLVRAWGFDYKNTFTWCKPMGTGNYWRTSTEILLLGVRGNLRFQDRGLKNYLYTARGKHSRKPDQVRLLIEKASPAPRLELFGREAVDGWTVWGNQINPTLFDNTRQR
jgi:N6-adenosine-specific RNA methylase IME4